jgi:hypothetical protein
VHLQVMPGPVLLLNVYYLQIDLFNGAIC